MSASINRAFLLKTRVAPTETVDAGEAYFFLEGTSVKYKDDTQTIKTLATGVTPEDVQDIVGTFITSGNNRITAVYNDAGNSFVITLVESNIVHQNLSGAGTNTHAQIDSHIANTSNPHATTAAQVGADTLGSAAAAQAFAVQRANHTGTQVASTISDLTEAVQDIVGPFVVGGAGITSTYNDGANALTIASTITQYTDEQAQDAVGAALTDTASVDLTYSDGLNQISAVVLPAGVNHNLLQNYVANQHIDHSAISVTGGTGLTGGGDLTANRIISMPNVGTAGTFGSASATSVITTDAQGRVSNAVTTPILITASQISDLTEAAQDAVGASLTDTASVDLAYNDAGNQITATVLPAGVNHDALLNFVANEHIDHTTVLISAGTGLTGGGDISANRTLNLANTAVTPGTYGVSGVPQFTVDAQGRITAASNGPALVIGDNFQQFSDLTVFTTTAATNQVAASFTTNTKEVGLYRVAIWWDWTYSSTTSDAIFSLFIDGVLQDGEFRMETSETVTQNMPWFWATYVNFGTVTTHTIQLQARSEAAGQTTTVNRVRSEIWRVS